MQPISTDFDKVLEHRRSTRVYDPNIKVPDEVIQRNVKRAILAPSSSNMQLWEFYHIKSQPLKDKMVDFCFNQKTASTAQELVVVVTRRDKYRSRAKASLDNYLKSIKHKSEAEYTSRDKQKINYFKKLMPFLYSRFFGLIGIVRWVITFFTGLFKNSYRNASEPSMRVVAHKSVGLAAQTFMLGMSADGYDTCPMEGFDEWRVRRAMNLPRGAEINMIISCGVRLPEGIWGKRFRVPFDEVFLEM